MAFSGWFNELKAATDKVANNTTPGSVSEAAVWQRGLATFRTAISNAAERAHVDTLSKLAVILARSGTDPIAPEYQTTMKAGSDAVQAALAGALNDLPDPPLGLLAIRDVALKDARTFWGGLAAIDAGGLRDQLVAYGIRLRDKMNELDKHFETLSGSAREIMTQELRLSQAMTEALAKAVAIQLNFSDRLSAVIDDKLPILKDPAKWLRKNSAEVVEAFVSATILSPYADKFKLLADQMSKPGAGYFKTGKELGIPAKELAQFAPELVRDYGMYTSDSFQDFVKGKLGSETSAVFTAMGALADTIETQAEQYRTFRDALVSTLPNHGSVLVVMTETRRKVDEFSKANLLQNYRDMADKAHSAFDSWRGNSGMSAGLQTDANEFTTAAITALTALVNADSDAYAAFIDTNRNMFFGSLSGKAEQAVFNPQIGIDATNRIRDLGLDQKLKLWRDQVITIDPRLVDYQANVMAAISDMPDEVQDEMRRLTTAAFDQARASNSVVTRLINAFDKMLGYAAIDQAQRDLDLKPVREKLQ